MKPKKLYQCPICGFHYLKREYAKQCEDYCKKHGSCSMEITQKSIERTKTNS